MKLLALRAARLFLGKHANAKNALRTWVATVKKERWTSFADVKKTFHSADVLPGNRVVFNIKGNMCRIVVKIHYNTGFVYIRFIGTHAEYDKINAEVI